MGKNVQYAFVENADQGLFLESKVESFGLEHITQKDIESFYVEFSSKSHFDSGLLPVDGSGILSIRTAGDHTQIGYQHKPGMYYINWGEHEGDPNAEKIYVAQPYRIVIADIYQGNLLGARTFYSPIPVQHPATPLYHVNLPNINCKGYRGNGVGWICLYHTHDISHYPFSEKVAHILDRCSGTEAYNDANMSETDGPRFYRQLGKPEHLCNPSEWEKYSAENGWEWTLDEDVWIPVLVKDIDHQDAHYKGGEHLTYVGAILGDYQAYYTDPIRPKPVNMIARSDLQMKKSDINNWFKVAYNSSATQGTVTTKTDPFNHAALVRENIASNITPPEMDEVDPNFNHAPGSFTQSDTFWCDGCGNEFDMSEEPMTVTEENEQKYCDECAGQYSVLAINNKKIYNEENSDLGLLPLLSEYIYLPEWTEINYCPHCFNAIPFAPAHGIGEDAIPFHSIINEDGLIEDLCCDSCLDDFSSSFDNCYRCNKLLPSIEDSEYEWQRHYVQTLNGIQRVCRSCASYQTSISEKFGYHPNSMKSCICGSECEASSFVELPTRVRVTVNLQQGNTIFLPLAENFHSTLFSDQPTDIVSNAFAFTQYKNTSENLKIDPQKINYHIDVFSLCHSCVEKIDISSMWTLRAFVIQRLMTQPFSEIILDHKKARTLLGVSVHAIAFFFT